MAFSSTDLEVDVEFRELQQDVVEVMEKQYEKPDIVKPLRSKPNTPIIPNTPM